MASSCFTRRARASRTARRARASVREAPSWTWPSASRETASRCSSCFGGGATRRAAVRGASSARRARSPATMRAAASAPPSRASAAPSSALPGTPSSSRAAVISGTGSARIASSVRRRAASSATWASAARMASGSMAGERRRAARRRAPPPVATRQETPVSPARRARPLLRLSYGGRQLLADDLVHQLAVRPALELGHHLSHDLSEILCPSGNGLPHGAPDLGRLFIRHGVLELEFAVLEVCEDGGEEERAPLIALFAGLVHRGAEPLGQARHVRPGACAGSYGAPRPSFACVARSAARNDSACASRPGSPAFSPSG